MLLKVLMKMIPSSQKLSEILISDQPEKKETLDRVYHILERLRERDAEVRLDVVAYAQHLRSERHGRRMH